MNVQSADYGTCRTMLVWKAGDLEVHLDMWQMGGAPFYHPVELGKRAEFGIAFMSEQVACHVSHEMDCDDYDGRWRLKGSCRAASVVPHLAGYAMTEQVRSTFGVATPMGGRVMRIIASGEGGQYFVYQVTARAHERLVMLVKELRQSGSPHVIGVTRDDPRRLLTIGPFTTTDAALFVERWRQFLGGRNV